MSLNTDYKLLKISMYDKILIAVILVFSVLALLSFRNTAIRQRKALVYFDGDFLQEVDIEKDGVVDLHLYEGSMKLEVIRGGIRVIESSCPHKLCLNMKAIRRRGQAIVCAPNKVLIKIKGIDSKHDAISY